MHPLSGLTRHPHRAPLKDSPCPLRTTFQTHSGASDTFHGHGLNSSNGLYSVDSPSRGRGRDMRKAVIQTAGEAQNPPPRFGEDIPVPGMPQLCVAYGEMPVLCRCGVRPFGCGAIPGHAYEPRENDTAPHTIIAKELIITRRLFPSSKREGFTTNRHSHSTCT